MTNQETNVTNVAITTLSSAMGATDLTASVVSTSDFPASPCYAVIDPDDDTKREIVLFDGTFTGTTLVTTDLANRYLAGSAAGSGILHDADAKVIVASGLAQLWQDINDRVEGHAHGGGTDGTQLDHGGLAGLTDDDHTQYSKADGTRAFTGEVGGVAPTVDASLATRGYVLNSLRPYVISNRNPAGADIGIPDSVFTAVSTQNSESSSLGSTFTETSTTVTVLVDGVYHIEAGLIWETNATGTRIITIVAGGSTVARSRVAAFGSGGVQQHASRLVALSANDTIELKAWQDSGGTLNVLADAATFRAVRFVGAT